MNYQAIVLAAGEGLRSHLSYHKVLYPIQNKPMIYWSILPFLEDKDCQEIVLVIHPQDEMQLKQSISDQKITFIHGGKTRQESVQRGLTYIHEEYVIIHDGARPFLKKDLLKRLKNALKNHACVIPVLPLVDSLKKVKNQIVIQTVLREDYRLIQSPQGFLTKDIKLAHQLAKHQNYADDSAMIEELLHQEVYCIDGDVQNKKMTNQEDFR